MGSGGEPFVEWIPGSQLVCLYIRPLLRLLNKGLGRSQIVPGQAVPGLKPADIAYFGILLRWCKKANIRLLRLRPLFAAACFYSSRSSRKIMHPISPGPEGEAPIAAAPSRLAVLGGGS